MSGANAVFAVAPVEVSSGNVANAAAVATLPAVAGKRTWISGLTVTASGATAALDVVLTVTGVTNTLSFVFTFPAGATASAAPLVVNFPIAIPSAATNTAVVVTLPAGGAGNTNAAVSAFGFVA